MKLTSLLSLALVSFLVLIQESSANDKLTVEAHDDITAAEFIPSDELEQEEETEQHVRVERSPGWRRRFRVRIRKPIRKVSSAVRKTVKKVGHGVKKAGRKIGQGIKKAASKVKSGVKKLASKTKAAIKKAGSKLKGAVKKAKERIKSNVRKLKSKVKKVVRLPVDLAKKLRDKLRSLNKKDEEEEEEEVIIIPTDPSIVTNPPIVTKPVCNSACQFIKNVAKEAEFFKKSFCAFYTVRRQHRDFLIDRNFNVTLQYILNDVMRESLNFYSTLAEILKAEDSKITLESREKVSSDCAGGKLMTCRSSGVDKSVRKLMCLIPCFGFSGCNQSDRDLQRAVDRAVEAYIKATNRTLKLLE